MSIEGTRFIKSKKVEQCFIKHMGADLGNILYLLWAEVVYMNDKFTALATLFVENVGKKNKIVLLNKAAPGLFYIIKNTLIDDMIIHITRLTDSTEGGRGKYKYLTIQRLRRLIIRKELEGVEEEELMIKEKELVKKFQPLKKLIDSAIEKAKIVREYRNQEIAHRDLLLALKRAEPLEKLTFSQMNDAVESIVAVLHYVVDNYRIKIKWDVVGGAEPLLMIIEAGLKEQKEQE